MSEKIIVTNYGRLKKKCGSTFSKVEDALKMLIAKDKSRGISTKVIRLDDAKQMKELKAPVVTTPKSPRQNKKAIDALYKRLQPDYIMILGAIDVIPHQDMLNTKRSAADQDRCAFGDLPYSCGAPYSKKPENFRNPTRVVGRLPDLVSDKQPDKSFQSTNVAYLVSLLKTAASYQSRPASHYNKYFAISADVWKDSTKLSLQNLFGSSSALNLSPPKGPIWTSKVLKKVSHFINCHGVEADPHYYGEKGGSFPIAHSAAKITKGKISRGTVVAAECCYGAELYNAGLADGQSGICTSYLLSGAYAFFGSTTIAYGPPSGNGAADLITQYFLKHILAGASAGRASLEARQDFVKASSASSDGALNPVDLKTLAQFYLLGDPSVHPVEHLETASKALDMNLMKGLAPTTLNFLAQRSVRRKRLISTGLALLSEVAYPKPSKKLLAKGTVKKTLEKMAANLKLHDVNFLAFNVHGGIVPKTLFHKSIPKRIFHLVEGESGRPKGKLRSSIVMVAEEQEGKIVSVREYQRR